MISRAARLRALADRELRRAVAETVSGALGRDVVAAICADHRCRDSVDRRARGVCLCPASRWPERAVFACEHP